MQQLGLLQAAPVVQGSSSGGSAPAPAAEAVRSPAGTATGALLPAPPASALPSAALSSPTDLDPALLSQLVCPITQEVMADPVSTADGTTFERSAIQGGWVQGHRVVVRCRGGFEK